MLEDSSKFKKEEPDEFPDTRCDWDDQYDDMYPEFAPDPIVIRCESEATILFAYWDLSSPYCEPMMQKFCKEHADKFEASMADDSFNELKVEYVKLEKPLQ